ncbi:MAG: divalent metal cation transporter [Phycisphaerae bacterium]|nr:divalent metal cation transporter [Phycisphaerae bacterium]
MTEATPPAGETRNDPGDRQDPRTRSGLELDALEREKVLLREIEAKPLIPRIGGYLKMGGPGWLQSAMTLGGGSAGSSLFAGAMMGYSLLWVQPLAMLLGVIMMSALAYQTLSTGKRPFHAVNTYAHPVLGWSWALASLIASVVWSFTQFNLAGSVVGDMLTAGQDSFPGWAVGFGRGFAGETADAKQAAMAGYAVLSGPIIVLLTLYVTWNYSRGSRGVRLFENVLKVMVGGIVVCFAIVAFKTGIDWGRLLKGFTSFHIPRDGDGLGVLIAMSANAVGINMTFLFPYTLIARGWGREHRGLAKFDLGVGMMVPFVLATGFVIISAANVLHPKMPALKAEIAQIEGEIGKVKADGALSAEEQQAKIRPLKDKAGKLMGSMKNAVFMSRTLEPFLGAQLSHYVFGLGIIGMTVSSIVMLMLVSGFVMTEICRAQPYGTLHKVGVLMPSVGFLAPILWGKLAFWLVVPTSVICFFFLPIAYVTFFVMMNSKRYLGQDRPEGIRRAVWNVGMALAILVVSVAGAYMIYRQLETWLG